MQRSAIPVLLVCLVAIFSVAQERKNGFDLSSSLIPAEKILHGGPARDGIPSIDRPKFVNAPAADYLRDKDRVIGVKHQNIAKAYPIKILDWHEIVNDRIADMPIIVSYCPLCGTGMVFQAGDLGTFGVSGLLYNSDVLMYDRKTESLWSQIMAQAISGPKQNTKLETLPASHTTWRDWRSLYPDTVVLSQDTGFSRNYKRSPYLGYADTPKLFFDVEYRNRAYRNKELVLGVSLNGAHKAYPFKELKRHRETRFEDAFGKELITVSWSATAQTASAFDRHGDEIPSVIAYWFAWYAFHPETEIFEAQR